MFQPSGSSGILAFLSKGLYKPIQRFFQHQNFSMLDKIWIGLSIFIVCKFLLTLKISKIKKLCWMKSIPEQILIKHFIA